MVQYSMERTRQPKRGCKSEQLSVLVNSLNVFMFSVGRDRWRGKYDGNGVFTVKTLRDLVIKKSMDGILDSFQWVGCILLEINCFFLAYLGSTPFFESDYSWYISARPLFVPFVVLWRNTSLLR